MVADLIEVALRDELDEAIEVGQNPGSLLPIETRSAVRVLRLTSSRG